MPKNVKFSLLMLLALLVGTISYIVKEKLALDRSYRKKMTDFPKSIAIIMDGNGRWAQKRNIPIQEGHAAGVKTLEKILTHAQKIGVQSLTLYIFSTENWKRSTEEVHNIFQLLEQYVDNFASELEKNKVRLKILGNLDQLETSLQKKLHNLEIRTASHSKFFLNLAINYGGRREIVDAAKKIALDVQRHKLKIDQIDENSFKRYLYNPDIMYPDLVIRTGNLYRLSNFLLWEMSYSELYFSTALWPDFNEKMLDDIVEEYQRRRRTYGGRTTSISPIP
jgi:undecaprenyl diphosphate synthase